jgi:hypothetical protein
MKRPIVLLVRRGLRSVPAMLTLGTALSACAGAASNDASAAHLAFWNALTHLCDQAFEGVLIEAPAGDTTFAGKRLVMHVRQCGPGEIRVPLHVGEDRSRTWVITQTASGLRLKHDHRHEDGSEDPVTQYGGDSAADGSAERQEFRADSATAALIPAASTNVWSLELVPGRSFVYALRREGTDRRFRIEFDITRSVPSPPPPWGS